MAWTPGQQIKQGKYQIVRKLGEGGFGITYLAQDTSGRSIVIKTPTDYVLNHPDAKKLLNDFFNEALKLAFCQHPHIVRVIEVIKDDPQDAIVMEYVEGQSLRDLLDYYGVLPEGKALNYIRQIGQALTVVHAQGLLHRDIKPDNILVRSHTDEAVLIDFGIAREFMSNLTETHTPLRTPCYAPIEQYDERAQRGAYTDVYGLAATLYVLVTGQLPVDAQGRKLEFVLHKNDLLRSPKSINPRVSDQVNDAILKGMSIDSKERPQMMQDWLNLLELPVVIPPKIPVQPDRSKSPVPPLGRQRFLKLMGFSGGGLLLVVGGKSAWDAISQRSTNISANNPKDFSFEVVTVNDRGQKIRKETKQAKFFAEDLGNGVTLEMIPIPGGTFQMGSPASEEGRFDDESPQHRVTVPAFFMGRYAVTQAQYETIMDSNPSNFKGKNRPVQQVSWNDAQAFCQKLSQKTGRKYRLPSEAEWEYACRAGTTTPFHFGASITTDLANYNGTDFIFRGNYANAPKGAPKGVDQWQTTDVGSFPPNAFGLYDMHGNVVEWCEDEYYSNYQGAPTDGSARTSSDKKYLTRPLRGGSYVDNPPICRSAKRIPKLPGYSDIAVGFRVACSA